ncbi:hypothetical protein JZ751_028508 [Albula glossodonta]|uniref:AB hydrolase-1 domain-containing protein n=1 Tax=Albula glossodonta TaxID=121402 RepID=A0A8T2MZZ8_9TELE|nr:hypothetical protein JZ751_028508 [Albula glossodonta]
MVIEYAPPPGVQNNLSARFVTLPTQDKIWTVTVTNRHSCKPEQTGVGLWVRNLDSLSAARPVLAFDLLGFGRSSRPHFPSDPALAEDQLVRSIEQWRQALGLERMILLGHSLGGYLATSYAIQHPDRVSHLILADPWGFPERPHPGAQSSGAVKRPAPPAWKFEDLFDDDTMIQYIYHCNAQSPSGEVGFRAMSESLGWAKRPMLQRVEQLSSSLQVTLLYGGQSWVDSSTGDQVEQLRPQGCTQTMVIDDASHHVYADQPEVFNRVVQNICDSVD